MPCSSGESTADLVVGAGDHDRLEWGGAAKDAHTPVDEVPERLGGVVLGLGEDAQVRVLLVGVGGVQAAQDGLVVGGDQQFRLGAEGEVDGLDGHAVGRRAPAAGGASRSRC